MANVTEIDPNTLKRVTNHDAARRQKELDAALARINQNNQVALASGPNAGSAPAPVIESGQVSDPASALANTVIELPTPAPEPQVPVVVEPSPAPAVSAEEYAKLQKSYKEATQALTPFMQRSAALAKDLKEERESTQSELKSLKETLAELMQAVKQPKAQAQVVYEPERDDELESLDPIIADRLRRMNQATKQQLEAVERRHQAELQALREQEEQRKADLIAERTTNQQRTWFEVFTKLVPDYKEFMMDGPKGQPLTDWAMQMPTEYLNAISSPQAHTPFFVAKVINEFKASMLPVAGKAKKPSLGDLAAVSLGSAPTRVEPPQPERLLTDYEIKNAQSIMDRLMRDSTNTKNSPAMRAQKAAEAQDFMERIQAQMK